MTPDQLHSALADVRKQDREESAVLLEEIAAGEESLAEAESADGDEVHEAIRRQNAWAFRRAAKVIRERA